MTRHVFGLMFAIGATAIMATAVAADRLADPTEALAVNSAAVRVHVGETDRASGMVAGHLAIVQAGVRVHVGETDRLSGMTDYYLVPGSFAPAIGFEPLPLAILTQLERINEGGSVN